MRASHRARRRRRVAHHRERPRAPRLLSLSGPYIDFADWLRRATEVYEGWKAGQPDTPEGKWVQRTAALALGGEATRHHPVSPEELRRRPPYAARLIERKGGKSTGRDGKTEHGVKQVRAGVLHFAPQRPRGKTPTHGDEHHDAWANGDDLPVVVPDKDHVVSGIAVVFRALPRDLALPTPETIAGKEVTWATVHVPMKGMNEAGIELRKLLADAQVLGAAEVSPRRRKK